MRYAKIIIDSRWGALGTLILLQCYGFLLAFFFAGAVRHALSASSGYEIPGHLLELGVGLAFLAVFICAQGTLLTDISEYLREQRDTSGWVREAARLHGVLRILVTVGAVVFYIGLLSGRLTLGLPELNLFILLGYQVFHPLASHFVGKRLRQTSYPTETRYISAAYHVFGLVMCAVASAVFYAFGMWMKSDHEPAYWMLQMIGAGVAVFGLAGFLLEDIKGREREVIVDPEDLATR
ncbi:MAG: hypothetical protein BWY59_01558 [Verrucomicrobia bacterium ADurb.Bin345]|nr:MAG: hypothetical protein BWY59_01558 [Verrucomicrobia bacterium ADurb.Bin345]